MTGRRRLGQLTREDLALADGIQVADGGLEELASAFEASEVPFRPTTATLMMGDRVEPDLLAGTITRSLRDRSPQWYIQPDPLGDYVVATLPSSHSNSIHVLTVIPTSDYRWQRLDRQISTARSGVSRFTLDLTQIKRLARRLEEHGAVTVSRTTGRSVEDGSSISRGWSTDRPPFDQAFQELIQHPASVRTVTFWLGRSTHLQVRRDGGATLYKGDARLFQDVVLDHLASAAQMRSALLRDRERPPNQPLQHALTVHFSSPPFASEESTNELVQLLYSDSEFGVAVLHSNPYFHATVTDYAVAASADVFVTDASEVTIFPGYKASMAFLSRIADRIADRFPFSHMSPTAAHPEVESSVFLSDE